MFIRPSHSVVLCLSRSSPFLFLRIYLNSGKAAADEEVCFTLRSLPSCFWTVVQQRCDSDSYLNMSARQALSIPLFCVSTSVFLSLPARPPLSVCLLDCTKKRGKHGYTAGINGSKVQRLAGQTHESNPHGTTLKVVKRKGGKKLSSRSLSCFV